MTPEQWLAAIEQESAVLAATPVDALELPVPTCPGWTVHDLLGHVGAVHRWAADKVDGTRLYRGYDGIAVPDGAEVIDWYVEGRDQLVVTLAGRDPDEPARTFVGEGTVAFWYRRQAGELAMHRWDLESALRPGEQTPIDAVLAADGIDEWLEVFAPRFVGMGAGVPADLIGRTLHLHGTDVPDAEWFLEVTADGFAHRREHAKADAAVRGPVSDLTAMLWHRRSYKDLDVVGDDSVVEPILDLVHVQ
ncbi:maleylpyruvate isomerase family mycothiol-dependent enzyme [Gordonia sp. CPCC 205515]|uniref:maleylpyruvate isomerase family mycothiol-dependent enzyme n=1 Tax=Gordonia sp. CPCC 205515 TaxID=3140791 RepID=UPI003AF33533